MARPSLIACTACACHMHAAELRCPHCGAARVDSAAKTTSASPQRAAVAVAMGLAVSVAELAACGDDSGVGGAGGTTSSDISSVAAYGVAQSSSTHTSATVGSSSSASVTGSSVGGAYGAAPSAPESE